MNQIRNQFLLNESDQALLNQGKNIDQLSLEEQQAIKDFAINHPIYNTAYLAAISFATTILLNANEGWDSHEYTMAGVEAAAQASVQIEDKNYHISNDNNKYLNEINKAAFSLKRRCF